MRFTARVRTPMSARLTRGTPDAVFRVVTEGQPRSASKARTHMGTSLAIGDVAAQTGIAAGTIRMWEQRYGFPDPERTASGYRQYHAGDVEALRRVQAFRHRGLSIPAAIERARETGASDHPSLYAAVAGTAQGA